MRVEGSFLKPNAASFGFGLFLAINATSVWGGAFPLLPTEFQTFDVMMTFVSAGLALGLAGAAHIGSSREPGVLGRPLAGKPPLLTTYLLRRDAEPSQALARFIERVEALVPGDA